MAKKKKRKKKKSQAPVIAAILIAVAAACVILVLVQSGPNNTVADQNRFFCLSGEEHAALIVDDELLEECGICVDGTVYVPYETVFQKINSGFYLEGDTVLLTLPEGTFSWTAGDDSGCLYKDSAGTFYLSADCLKAYSDIELAQYEAPHRVVIRTSWEDVQTAAVLEDTQLRVQADEHSEIAVALAAQETVVLLEEGDAWTKAAAADGHIGYLKTETLSGETVPLTHEPDPRFSFSHIRFDQKIKMVWHYIDRVENNVYLPGMLADTKDLNVISPTWFVLGDAKGNLISYGDTAYVEQAHNTYGLSIWAMVSDYTGEDSSTGEILSHAESRKNVVDQLVNSALTYGLEGINIDFETITSEQAPAFLQFLRELTSAAHAHGLIISVDNYVPLYTRYYKRAEQAKIVDYLFIMGYDEHTARSPEIGSVASLPFVEQGITDTLEEVPPEQVVLGVPFFTRGWIEPFGKADFDAVYLEMYEIQNFLEEHGIKLDWDAKSGQYYGTADSSEARYTIWSEDARSLGEKLKLVDTYQLAGACAWRVGVETADVWDTWESILQ